MYTYVPPFFGMGETFRNSNTIITGWVGVGKNGNYQLLFITFFQMLFFCTVVLKRCFQKKNKAISVFNPN